MMISWQKTVAERTGAVFDSTRAVLIAASYTGR
jgi:hypothetical protein